MRERKLVKRVAVLLTEEEDRKLRQFCQEHHLSMSGYLRTLLAERIVAASFSLVAPPPPPKDVLILKETSVQTREMRQMGAERMLKPHIVRQVSIALHGVNMEVKERFQSEDMGLKPPPFKKRIGVSE